MAKLLIGVVGMPGAGKSLISKAAREMYIPVVVMGDIVRDEARLRGLDSTQENVGMTMLQMRSEMGPAVVAKKCLPKLTSYESNVLLVEGIRSTAEVEEFRSHFTFVLVAIHASPSIRYNRLFDRSRSDDPQSYRIFMERDQRELDVGIGYAIALADFVLENQSDMPGLKQSSRSMLEGIVREYYLGVLGRDDGER